MEEWLKKLRKEDKKKEIKIIYSLIIKNNGLLALIRLDNKYIPKNKSKK